MYDFGHKQFELCTYMLLNLHLMREYQNYRCLKLINVHLKYIAETGKNKPVA